MATSTVLQPLCLVGTLCLADEAPENVLVEEWAEHVGQCRECKAALASAHVAACEMTAAGGEHADL